MENDELKEELKILLDSIPEEVLKEILVYIKDVKKRSVSNVKLTHKMIQIIREDRELMKKLAG